MPHAHPYGRGWRDAWVRTLLGPGVTVAGSDLRKTGFFVRRRCAQRGGRYVAACATTSAVTSRQLLTLLTLAQ
jgi:hypothetical protein